MRCYLKQRENGIWYIWRYDAATGQCGKHSAHTTDYGKAQEALAKYILSSPDRRELPDPTIAQVMLRYWELHGKNCFGAGTVKLVMGRVAEKIPEMRVSQFARKEQEAFVAGLVPSTGRRYLGQVFAALNWLDEREELMCEVPKKLRVLGSDRAGARPLKLAELRSLCDKAATERQRLFLILMIATAQRPAHVLELTWDRVDFATGTIDFQDPNRPVTKKTRPIVPMCPTLQAFLVERRSVGPVLQRHGRRLSGHRMLFNRIAAEAKVSGSAYGIRKATATYLRRNGVPEMDLKGMLGHRLGGVTDRYAHFDPEYMNGARAAAEALLREISPSWLSKYFPDTNQEAAKALKFGAGKGARTLDLNLGKAGTLSSFQRLKTANDD